MNVHVGARCCSESTDVAASVVYMCCVRSCSATGLAVRVVRLFAQVLFNIGGPALNQLANISDKREGSSNPIRKALKSQLKKRK